jgi:hypothetical protein
MRRLSLRTAQFHRRLSIGDHRRLFNDRRRLFCLPVESLRLIIRAALKATDRYGSDVKNKLSSFAAVVVRLANSSPIPAQLADPTFVVNKPRVLVAPDNLPILQSEQRPAVDPKLDPSELNTLALCSPGVCSQEALDASGAYCQTTAGSIAYYHEHGHLADTSEQLTTKDASASYRTQAITANGDPRITDAGVPAAGMPVGATLGAFELLPSGAATYRIFIRHCARHVGTEPELVLSYNGQ